MKGTKGFIIKILICTVLVVAIDRLVGLCMKHAVNNGKNGDTYRYNYLLLKATPPVVVLGSSRAADHYNDVLMQQDLGYKTINYGYGGSSVYMYYITLKTLLQRYTPKMVVIDINHEEFAYGELKTDRINSLYPFYDKLNLSDSDISLVSPYEKYKLLFYTYRFNNQFIELLRETHGKKEDTATLSNYTGLPPAAKGDKQVPIQVTYNVDKTSVDTASYQCLQNIITLCQSKNIKLVICTSPFSVKLPHNSTSIATAQLCSKYGVPYFNYLNNNYITFAPNNFSDANHLDSSAANIFTHDFDARIKSILQ